MHVENLIILVSLTILVSYVSGLIYSKTRIPDVIWLMGFGILMGPVLNYVDKDLFNELAPLMSIIALSIILFEAGINVDIVMLLGSMGKAMVLSVASIMGSILLIGILTAYFLVPELTFLQGMLLGAMVGGTSTVAVYGILTSIGGTIPNLDSTRVLLTMESIVSDPVCIISSIYRRDYADGVGDYGLHGEKNPGAVQVGDGAAYAGQYAVDRHRASASHHGAQEHAL